MSDNTHHLMTPLEAEALLGTKYFYRQRIYRMGEMGRISTFKLRNQACFLGSHIVKAFLEDLTKKIASKFPQVDTSKLRIFYDVARGKRIVIDGLFGRGIVVDTENENEEDVLIKIQHIMDFLSSDPEFSEPRLPPEQSPGNTTLQARESDNQPKERFLTSVLPEEISWVRVDTGVIEGIEVKSYILISLPSVAQFIGIRPDEFVRWVSTTTFSHYILSAHYKNLQGTQKSVPWIRGVTSGYTPLIPFELLPEVIIAFRNSGRTPAYPKKAEMLYEVAKATLEAVGLAISGNRERAAAELARVGRGLGIDVAEQIIAIFKQYETKEFQVESTKKFHSKVKEIKADFAVTTGNLTLGITNRSAENWRAYGIAHGLPSQITSSSRNVMRALSPADGVGMAFGEQHFIKDPVLSEAIETGKQGKDFYQRLKSVGLLDEPKDKKGEKSGRS